MTYDKEVDVFGAPPYLRRDDALVEKRYRPYSRMSVVRPVETPAPSRMSMQAGDFRFRISSSRGIARKKINCDCR